MGKLLGITMSLYFVPVWRNFLMVLTLRVVDVKTLPLGNTFSDSFSASFLVTSQMVLPLAAAAGQV